MGQSHLVSHPRGVTGGSLVLGQVSARPTQAVSARTYKTPRPTARHLLWFPMTAHSPGCIGHQRTTWSEDLIKTCIVNTEPETHPQIFNVRMGSSASVMLGSVMASSSGNPEKLTSK